MRRPRPIRNADAGDLIEMMLVVAVATIIVIRVILEASGYPKLGGGGLHIAHVLYGGLMMIVALILVFTLLNIAARWAAAFIGGVGFGFFIDEVGKFISNDVNYFFAPSFAVMYVVFIVLFLAAWAIRRAPLRAHDALANALSLLREERDGGLDAEAKRDVLLLLGQANPADPLVPVLRDRVRDMPTIERRNLTPYSLWRARLAEWYKRVSGRPWFARTILAVMAVLALASLGNFLTPFLSDDTGVDGQSHDFAAWFQAASAGVTAALIIAGFAAWRRSRITAYRLFKAGTLVSLLITQVFVFYHDQLPALAGVVFTIVVYAGLSYLIAREESSRREAAGGAVAAAPVLAPEVT